MKTDSLVLTAVLLFYLTNNERVFPLVVSSSVFLWTFSFCTDEVGALVFDMGSYSVRAGYAGEDCPKV